MESFPSFEPPLRWGDAAQVGISTSELRRPAWSRISRGYYSAHPEADRVVRSLERTAVVLDGSLSHLSAAQLYGLWLPNLPAWLPTIVALPPESRHLVPPNVYVARTRAGYEYTVERGVRCVRPEICVAQLAEDLAVVDLVIAIDSVLSQGLCTLQDIEGAIRTRQRGLPRLRQALRLADPRSESAWETILRLIHVVCGIEVEPQYVITDERGIFVARADLRVKGTRRLSEYDGAVHRDRIAHQHDLRRDKALARLSLERYGYIATELIHDPAMVIRDADEARGVAHDPARINAWLTLASDSTLTPYGKRRLLGRLRRFLRRRRT